MNSLFEQKWNWNVVVPLFLLHAGALIALWFFSWTGFAICLLFYVLTGWCGITLFYHRGLTHKGYETHLLTRRILATLGTLAGEYSPIMWVGVHRLHHSRSDRDGDPHSPYQPFPSKQYRFARMFGFLHSHILWTCRKPSVELLRHVRNKTEDIRVDPYLRWLDRHYARIHLIAIIVIAIGGAGAGWFASDWRYGLSIFLWAVAVRMVAVYHATWLVNSASHLWGYRRYQTIDNSRNNFIVSLLDGGEGWHNNHHKFPRLARHGHKWWEVDCTYYILWCMKKLGLAWNVRDKIPKPKQS